MKERINDTDSARREIRQGIKQEIRQDLKKNIRSGTMGEYIRSMFSLSADTASHEEIRDRLLSGGRVTGTNMCILICAIIIASVGLNTGSTAVIIGAMLISPLMGSILAIAYGTVSNNLHLVEKHLTGLLIQIVFSLAASIVFFWLSPIKEPTSELLARTQPGFFDVIVATAGGIAGIIGQTRQDKVSNVIPGVAIATALMPPVCTCGYAIANANMRMFLGAAYLFLINAYFIFNSAALVLTLLKVPKVRELTESQWRRQRFRMIRNTVVILLPSLVMLFLIGRD